MNSCHDPSATPQASPDSPSDAARKFLLHAFVPALLGLFVLITSIVKSFQFAGWRWVVLVVSTYILFVVGRNIHLYAYRAAKNLSANMNTLISLGTIAAWVWSVAALWLDKTLYFETVAVVTLVVLLGQWLESRATQSTQSSIAQLSQMIPKRVVLETGEEIEITELQPGMRFRAREGEFIASDGVVVDGAASIDTSMITGEPLNRYVESDDEVVGSTIVTKGSLLVEATHTGENTFHRHIIRLISETLDSQAPVQKLVDKISGIYAYCVIGIAAVTIAVWLALGYGGVDALESGIATLIIACPCALGLATPIAIMAATSRGAQFGIILKNTTALEQIKNINIVALDKTGTLTSGKIHIQDVVIASSSGATKSELLNLAFTLESHSTHPIAIAIAASATTNGQASDITEIENVAGAGVVALSDKKAVAIGKAELFENVPEDLAQAQIEAQTKGDIAVFCGAKQKADGLIILSDDRRAEASSVVSKLKALNMQPVMITGDAEIPARQLGEELGIDEVHFNVLPDQKADIVEGLKGADKNTVLMVGDGTNDAAALTAADLSIAIGSATEVALESADIALLGTDLNAIPTAIELTLKTRATIIKNLFWAFIYNTAAVPLAAVGLLSPIIASIAMSCSSLFVVLNSIRLHRAKF